MKVYKSIEQYQPVHNAVVTTGTFDGVHLGHQKIIKRLQDIARKESGETVLLTFYPHPRTVLFPESHDLKLLNTLDEKISLLEASGIDHLIVYPFTKEFSMLSSLDFVKNILIKNIGTKSLVIGYNHHFGRNREGSFAHLKDFGPVYGFKVEEISAKDVDQVEISSTKIREALVIGDIETANKYLGYAYFINGLVVKGKQIGRKIGYPTANIELNENSKLIPGDGIYAVTVSFKNVVYKGMLSIGMNPTVNGNKRTIEVNIFNFSGDIYGEDIRVSFFEKIRMEKKFENLEALTQQLALDRIKSLELLK